MTPLDYLASITAKHRLMVHHWINEYRAEYRCTCTGWDHDENMWVYIDERGGPEGAGETEDAHARHLAEALIADPHITIAVDSAALTEPRPDSDVNPLSADWSW